MPQIESKRVPTAYELALEKVADERKNILEEQQEKELKLLYAKEIFQRETDNKSTEQQQLQMQELLAGEEFNLETLQLGLSPFQGDLGIVGHAGEDLLSPLDRPKQHGEYTLSTEVSKETVEALKGKNIVLIIQCMDKDGAEGTYDAVLKGYADTNITPVVLSLGGGIAQEDVITRDVSTQGLPMSLRVNRETGLKLAVKSVVRIVTESGGSVAAVHALTHDCRCGACAFYNNGVGVPEQLDVNKGDIFELKEMMKIAREKARAILTTDVIGEGVPVKTGTAHFGEDLGDGQFKRKFEQIIYNKDKKKIKIAQGDGDLY